MDDTKLTRGERFKDTRILHNKNGKQRISDVARETGVSQSCISDLENDDKERGVSYYDVKKLAIHYGVSVDDLLGVHGGERPSYVCEYTGLSPDVISGLHSIKDVASFIDFFNCLIRFCGLHGEILSHIQKAVSSKQKAQCTSGFDENAYFFSESIKQTFGVQNAHGSIQIPDGIVPLEAAHAAEFYIDWTTRIFRQFLSDYVERNCRPKEADDGERS